jgi:hypothetical protein
MTTSSHSATIRGTNAAAGGVTIVIKYTSLFEWCCRRNTLNNPLPKALDLKTILGKFTPLD